MSDVPEMVERVARALCKGRGENPDGSFGKSLADGHQMRMWERYVDDARSAIAAMREPSNKMADSGMVFISAPDGWLVFQDDAVKVWQAMIDEALR